MSSEADTPRNQGVTVNVQPDVSRIGVVILGLLLAAACGSAGTSGVEGILREVGGPAGLLDRPVAGTVAIYPYTGEGYQHEIYRLPGAEPLMKVPADSMGRFHADLPPGAYLLTAVMRGGTACSAQQVLIEPDEYLSVVITCAA
jgi:hypothetical protein